MAPANIPTRFSTPNQSVGHSTEQVDDGFPNQNRAMAAPTVANPLDIAHAVGTAPISRDSGPKKSAFLALVLQVPSQVPSQASNKRPHDSVQDAHAAVDARQFKRPRLFRPLPVRKGKSPSSARMLANVRVGRSLSPEAQQPNPFVAPPLGQHRRLPVLPTLKPQVRPPQGPASTFPRSLRRHPLAPEPFRHHLSLQAPIPRRPVRLGSLERIVKEESDDDDDVTLPNDPIPAPHPLGPRCLGCANCPPAQGVQAGDLSAGLLAARAASRDFTAGARELEEHLAEMQRHLRDYLAVMRGE